jgi:hypothetical protein
MKPIATRFLIGVWRSRSIVLGCTSYVATATEDRALARRLVDLKEGVSPQQQLSRCVVLHPCMLQVQSLGEGDRKLKIGQIGAALLRDCRVVASIAMRTKSKNVDLLQASS